MSTRTERFQLLTPASDDARLIVSRELLTGALALPLDPISRRAEQVATRPLPSGPVTLATYGELIALLTACGDDLAADERSRLLADAEAAAAMEYGVREARK